MSSAFSVRADGIPEEFDIATSVTWGVWRRSQSAPHIEPATTATRIFANFLLCDLWDRRARIPLKARNTVTPRSAALTCDPVGWMDGHRSAPRRKDHGGTQERLHGSPPRRRESKAHARAQLRENLALLYGVNTPDPRGLSADVPKSRRLQPRLFGTSGPLARWKGAEPRTRSPLGGHGHGW